MNQQVEELRHAVALIAKAVEAEVGAEEPSALGELLGWQREIERARRDLKDALDDLSEHAAGAMPSRQMRVAGLGAIERTGGTDRSGWDHDALFAIALARGIDAPDRYDGDTGEMLVGEGQAVLREIRAMAGTPGYWKVTAIREAGHDPSDYCTETKARMRVKLPKDERAE